MYVALLNVVFGWFFDINLMDNSLLTTVDGNLDSEFNSSTLKAASLFKRALLDPDSPFPLPLRVPVYFIPRRKPVKYRSSSATTMHKIDFGLVTLIIVDEILGCWGDLDLNIEEVVKYNLRWSPNHLQFEVLFAVPGTEQRTENAHHDIGYAGYAGYAGL